MFNLFGRKTAKEFQEAADDICKIAKAVETAKQEHKEHYRVGRTTDGYTTLTLQGEHGATMTLTMNQEACEQMIRMLESTFTVESAEPTV